MMANMTYLLSAGTGVFQSTNVVTQLKCFQTDNLNFTVQNIPFMYNKMSIQVFLDVGAAKDKF